MVIFLDKKKDSRSTIFLFVCPTYGTEIIGGYHIELSGSHTGAYYLEKEHETHA